MRLAGHLLRSCVILEDFSAPIFFSPDPQYVNIVFEAAVTRVLFPFALDDIVDQISLERESSSFVLFEFS